MKTQKKLNTINNLMKIHLTYKYYNRKANAPRSNQHHRLSRQCRGGGTNYAVPGAISAVAGKLNKIFEKRTIGQSVAFSRRFSSSPKIKRENVSVSFTFANLGKKWTKICEKDNWCHRAFSWQIFVSFRAAEWWLAIVVLPNIKIWRLASNFWYLRELQLDLGM